MVVSKREEWPRMLIAAGVIGHAAGPTKSNKVDKRIPCPAQQDTFTRISRQQALQCSNVSA